jgi:circadian clock protein KaiB
MPTKKSSGSSRAIEPSLRRTRKRKYILRLYITGMTPRSMRAIENVKSICDDYLTGRYELQVIDIYQQPKLAKGEQIIAVPTLIKKLPAPLKRMIGDMADADRVLMGLDLAKKE